MGAGLQQRLARLLPASIFVEICRAALGWLLFRQRVQHAGPQRVFAQGLLEQLAAAELSANRFWSAIGHIGVEVPR